MKGHWFNSKIFGTSISKLMVSLITKCFSSMQKGFCCTLIDIKFITKFSNLVGSVVSVLSIRAKNYIWWTYFIGKSKTIHYGFMLCKKECIEEVVFVKLYFF